MRTYLEHLGPCVLSDLRTGPCSSGIASLERKGYRLTTSIGGDGSLRVSVYKASWPIGKPQEPIAEANTSVYKEPAEVFAAVGEMLDSIRVDDDQ